MEYGANDKLRYVPDWIGEEKRGRPKANKRHKGIMDHIADATKKRPRKKKKYCSICEMWNHNTNECFKNPNYKGSKTNTTTTTSAVAVAEAVGAKQTVEEQTGEEDGWDDLQDASI